MKTKFQRILGYNLAILLGLAVVLRLFNRGNNELGFIMLMAVAILLTFLANALIAMLSDKAEERQAYLLSALLVVLIGFGACYTGTVLPI
jgi:hypothetical protein